MVSKSFLIITLVLLVSLIQPGLTLAGPLDSELVSMLTKELSIKPDQALGGAGSLLKFAKGKLSDDNFSKVASAIPEMDSLINSAPKAGALETGLSKLTGGSGKLGGLASLAGSFKSLGLDGGMVNNFVPVILKYAESKGGSGIMSILSGVLK
jgi:hypothetical protein